MGQVSVHLMHLIGCCMRLSLLGFDGRLDVWLLLLILGLVRVLDGLAIGMAGLCRMDEVDLVG